EEPPEGGPAAQSLLDELQALAAGAPPNEAVGTPAIASAADGTEEPRQVAAAPTPASPPEEPNARKGVASPSAEEGRPQRQDAAGAAPVSIHVDLDALDEIAGLAGDVLVEGARAGARTRDLKELLEGWNA